MQYTGPPQNAKAALSSGPERKKGFGKASRLGLALLLVVMISYVMFIYVEISFDIKVFSKIDQLNKEVFSDTLYDSWVKSNRALTEMLALRFVEPIHEDNTYEIYNFVRNFMIVRDVINIHVLDSKGAVLASAGKDPPLKGSVLNDPIILKTISEQATVIRKRENILDVAVPVFYGIDMEGLVIVGYSEKENTTRINSGVRLISRGMRNATLGERRNMVILGIVTSALLVLTGYFFMRGLRFSEDEIIQKTRKVEESLSQLRTLSIHLQDVREEERRNLSMRVHDDLGQILSTIKMEIARIERKLGTEVSGDSLKLNDLNELLNTSIELVQDITADLRPTSLDDFGLSAAVESTLFSFGQRTGVTVKSSIGCDNLELDLSTSTNIFRILQESLVNISRHAEASRIWVTLKGEENELVMEISDNGRGITEDELSSGKSFGIMGIKERALRLSGILYIGKSRRTSSGTTLELRVPLDKGINS